jgi:predicted ABC-type ATPase
LKIERTLTLEPNLSCVLSINKDYILYIFVQKNDLTLAFDAVKKITEFFNSNIKMFAGASGQARLETIGKKFVEFMSVMEEFLYTREIAIR